MSNPKSRGNGQGSVYYRKDRKCWAIGINSYQNGHRKQKVKSGFRTRREALFWLNHYGGEPEYKPVLLIDLYESWSQKHFVKISPGKISGYELAWSRLKSLHFIPITELSYHAMQNTIDKIEGYYPAKYAKFVLTSIYSEAIKDNIVSVNTAEYIELPPAPKGGTKKAFSEENITLMWARLHTVPFLAYPLIMIYTGMRPGELMKLETNMIDFNEHSIVGAGSKTNLGISQPIVFPDKIEPLLRNYKSIAERKDKMWFYEEYKKALEEAGIPYLSPNCCRHTCASRLAAQNIPPALIKQIMRHTNYQTTLGYTHFDSKPGAEALNKI